VFNPNYDTEMECLYMNTKLELICVCEVSDMSKEQNNKTGSNSSILFSILKSSDD
jgi:hypothetical protein